MRTKLGALAGALTLVLSGCASSHHVRTMLAPEADVAALQAFRLLPIPNPRDRAEPGAPSRPTIDTAITSRLVRETISQTLRSRGYIIDEDAPDFLVAVYASRDAEFDVTAWGYAYPQWPDWDALPRYREQREHYAAGTVVIDIIAANGKQLLWRGSGSATMTVNPVHDTEQLRQVAKAIVERVPRARVPVVASGR